MGKNLKTSIGASLLLHFAMLAIVFIMKPNAVRPVQTHTVSLIEFKNLEKSSSKIVNKEKAAAITKSLRKPKGPGRDQHNNNKQSGRPNAFDYGSFSPRTSDAGSFSDHQNARSDGWAGNQVMETMGGIGLSEYSKNFNFFEHLTGKLNASIPYPKELWEHKITGNFWIKIEINNRGRLLRVIETSNTSPVLTAYALINIYQTLESPLPEQFWYTKDKTLALQLNFDYSVSSIGTQQEIQSAQYFKNRFEFVRVAKVPNFIQEVMTDYARYVPPIIPTPLGPPIVNFVQVYNMIQAWSGDDPLAKKKTREIMTRDKLKELLEQTQKDHYPEA